MLAPPPPRPPGLLKRLVGALATPTLQVPRAQPYKEMGVSGTSVFGGYIQTKERSSAWVGPQRYATISDMAVNASIVATGVHYFLNLIARPKWSFDPADESAEAKAAAELVQECLEGMNQPWSRVVRHVGTYRFYGFAVHEWTAKKRADGRVGFHGIEARPQHTIERWAVAGDGHVAGVFQVAPDTGAELGIPRSKLLYLVDDVLTDSPEGVGIFRHLAEPWERLKVYYELEARGFERDLRGIPVGRVPYSQLREMVKSGDITQAKADEMVLVMEKFVQLQKKESNTAITLDSIPYYSQAADGVKVAAIPQWGLELLSGGASGMAEVAAAITRTQTEMARLLTCEHLMMGESAGNRALSEDKSRNLYLVASAVLEDIRAGVQSDLIPPLCDLNGIPEALRPKPRVEDINDKDAEAVASVLAKMAQAGAVLAPDDPVIEDVRNLMGVSAPTPIPPELLGMGGKDGADEEDDPEDDPEDVDKAYNPNQPRAPKGSADGGQWTDGDDGAADVRSGPLKERVKAAVDEVYESFYPNPLNDREVGFANEDQTAMVMMEVHPHEDAMYLSWLNAYPNKSGMGTRGVDRLKEIATKHNVPITLTPWKNGKIGEKRLVKIFNSWGFKGKSGMLKWTPSADAVKAFDPNQPRAPKGTREGGRWVGEGGAAGPSSLSKEEIEDAIALNEEEQEAIDSKSSMLGNSDSGPAVEAKIASLQRDYSALEAINYVLKNDLKAHDKPDIAKATHFEYVRDAYNEIVAAMQWKMEGDVASGEWLGSMQPGAGSKMISAAMKRAGDAGAKEFKLRAKWGSQKVYRKLGFETVGDYDPLSDGQDMVFRYRANKRHEEPEVDDDELEPLLIPTDGSGSLRKRFDPMQPRHPRGHPDGGQWRADEVDGPGGPDDEFADRDASASDLYKQTLREDEASLQAVREKVGEELWAKAMRAEEEAAKRVATNAPVEVGGFVRPDGTYTPERQALHTKIISDLFGPEAVARATPAPGEAPSLIMTGGRPASGKTSGLRGLGIDQSRYIYISADEIQEKLPGYKGSIAGLFNPEAQDIAIQAENVARRSGLNVLYDATMKSLQPARDRVRIYKEAGYEVESYFMHTAPQTSAVRALRRFESSGRYVPAQVSLGARTNEATFDALKPEFDRWAIYDNNGSRARLVGAYNLRRRK